MNRVLRSIFCVLLICILAVGVFPAQAIASNTAQTGAEHGVQYYIDNKSTLQIGWWDYIALSSAGYEAQGFAFEKQASTQAAKVASNIIAGVITKADTLQDVESLQTFYANGKYGSTSNDQIWSIIALHMAGAEFDRQKAAQEMIRIQLADGGYAFSGTIGDVDMTGMALSALAILKSQTGIAAAITKAVGFLSNAQQPSGGFKDRDFPEYSYHGEVNPNSTAVALIGLIDAGIDISQSSWIKGGRSIIDSLLDFMRSSGGYYIPAVPTAANQMAVAQVLTAFEAAICGESVFLNVPTPVHIISSATASPEPTSLVTATPSQAPSVTPEPSATPDPSGGEKEVSLKVIGHSGIIAVTAGGYKSSATTAYELLEEVLTEQNITWKAESSTWGKYIQSIAGQQPYSDGYWAFSVNGQMAAVGVDIYVLMPGDEIQLHYDGYRIDADPATVGSSFAIRIKRIGFNYILKQSTALPIADAQIVYNGQTQTTDANGSASFTCANDKLSAQITVSKDKDPMLWEDFSASIDICVNRSITISILGFDDFHAQTPANYLTDKTTAFDALMEFTGSNQIAVEYENSTWGKYIQSIAGQQPYSDGYWAFSVNGQMAAVGADSYVLLPGDEIQFHYQGYHIYADPAIAGESFAIHIQRIGYDYTLKQATVSPIADAQIIYNGQTQTTDATGSTSFICANEKLFAQITVSKEKDPMLWEDFSGSLEIPLSQNVTIKIIGTDGYSAQTPQDYKTQTTSAFDALKEFADANDIEIEYGNTTLGVYIKSIANIQPQKCSYWAFLVNGQMSNVGVGDYKVQQGDTLIFCYEGFYSYIDGQEPEENESFLIKMDKVGYDSTLQLQKTTNIEGAQVTYNGSTKLTGSDGSASFVATSGSKPAVVELAKEKDGALWEDYSHTIIIDVKVPAATPTPTPTPTPEGSGGGDSSPKVYLKVVGDGTLILGRKSLTLVSGDTPISILKREVSDVVTTGSGTSVYVNKIGSLAEFDKGPQSGWKFKINGEVKNLSAGACKLKDGDEVEWFYVYTEDQAYARVNVTIKIIGTDGYSAQTPQDYKTQTTFAFDALKEFTDANDIEIEYENTAFGVYIQSIANIQPQKCSYWAFLVNGQMSSVGAGDYEVQPGDTLIFSYEGFYSYIDVQEPVENEPFSVKMVKIGCDTTLQAQKVTSIEGAQVTYNDIVKQTDSTGSASFVAAVGSKPLVVELAKEKDSALWEDFSQTITIAAKVPTPTPTPTAKPSGGGSSSSKAYLKVVGDGSVILNRKSVILQNGDTPITILKREVSGVVTSGSGSGAYVSKIGDLAEFDRGAQSGWKFKLNGDVKNLSAGAFILKDGDEVEWFYVYTVSQTSSGRGAVTPTSTPIPTQSASPTATDAPMENITRLADKKGVQVLAQAMTLDGFAPMILAAAGQSSDAIAQMIVNHVVENKGKYRKVTDIERMAINAVKLGLDAENIGGYNLIEAIISHENIEMQGLNGVVFGLLALDMVEVKGNYSGPNTKEALLQKIIARQNENGGFALDGTNSEVDMTAFAITALAPYHNRENVRSTIEKALSWLDSVKTAAGEYQSADGEENCESLSWVIIAKSAMGVDAANEIKLLSAYELSSGYFSHLKNGQQDMMATEQALMAICAYEKNKNGQGSFFGSQKDYIFTDTKDISPWAVTFIASAAQKGIVKGDDAGRVNPQKKLTRSELITMLLRIANLHADSSIPAQFKDVVPTDWFYGYVMIGYREGFIKGYSEDTFGPQGLVSRQEMAVIAARMLKLSDIDNRPVDYDLASDWAKDAVEAVFTAGIMTGDGTNFNPKDEMTREQAIKTVLLIGEQYK